MIAVMRPGEMRRKRRRKESGCGRAQRGSHCHRSMRMAQGNAQRAVFPATPKGYKNKEFDCAESAGGGGYNRWQWQHAAVAAGTERTTDETRKREREKERIKSIKSSFFRSRAHDRGRRQPGAPPCEIWQGMFSHNAACCDKHAHRTFKPAHIHLGDFGGDWGVYWGTGKTLWLGMRLGGLNGMRMKRRRRTVKIKPKQRTVKNKPKPRTLSA